MIDNLKTSSKNAVENNASHQTSTSTGLKSLNSNSEGLKYSLKSLTNSKNSRCVVCYKLLQTWKGSRLCRYYDVNTVIQGKRALNKLANEHSNENCDAKIKSEVVDEAFAGSEKTKGKKIENNNKSGVNDGTKKSKADDKADVNLVNGEVNHHGDSNNLVSFLNVNNKTSKVFNNNYTIGDLIQRTLSLKPASAKHQDTSVQANNSSDARELRSGKICDCCLDNISLIDYHMSNSSKLKEKMIRKFRFANKFHSNRFALNRKCRTKRLRGNKGASANSCFLLRDRIGPNRFKGLNGYSRLSRLHHESDSTTAPSAYLLDHDRIDKLNSLLENVSLIASALLNNPKAIAKPDPRNGLVVEDHQDSVTPARVSSTPSVSKNTHDLRSHHANQPRIIESNELINNLNKLNSQQSSGLPKFKSGINNNSNRFPNKLKENPVVTDPSLFLTLAALVNKQVLSGQQIKFNNLNQGINNGSSSSQEQFSDQHQSNSVSPQETNRRKRKSINPSRLPKLGKYDESYPLKLQELLKLQSQKGGENANADAEEENESEEENENDQDNNHQDEKASRQKKEDSRPLNKSASGSNLNSRQAAAKVKPFQKAQQSFNKAAASTNASARKGFLAKGSAGNGQHDNENGVYDNENVLGLNAYEEDNENYNNEYDADGDQDGGDNDDLNHDHTSDNNHFENEDDNLNHDNDENNNENQGDSYNGNNYDDFNDENDEETELYHNNNGQDFHEENEDENIDHGDGAESMAYENYIENGAYNQDLDGNEPETNDHDEQNLNNEIRKINSKSNSRHSKTVANAKFSAAKPLPAPTNRNAKPVLQKTQNIVIGNNAKSNVPLNSGSFKPIANPNKVVSNANKTAAFKTNNINKSNSATGLNVSLGQSKAGGSRNIVFNNNQNRGNGDFNGQNKNGNNRVGVNAIANKGKPLPSGKANNLNSVNAKNGQNLKGNQVNKPVVDVKKTFKTNSNNNSNGFNKKQNAKQVQPNHAGVNLRQNASRAVTNKVISNQVNNENVNDDEYYDEMEDDGFNNLNHDGENLLDNDNEQYDQADDLDGDELFGSQSPSVSPSPSHSSSVIHQTPFNGSGSNNHERSKSNSNGNSGGSAMKHVCQICEKTFKTQNILRQHMRIHTGDKPFVCELCSKAFSQMASLKYHLATHSDDRPFKCENCSKTFKLKPPFKKHIKECQPRHHGSSNSLYSQSNHNMSGIGLNQDYNDDE